MIWPFDWENALPNGVDMTDATTYRRRKQMFFAWLRISLIGLIVLRISGLWLLTPAATAVGAIGVTLILVAFVWPVFRQHIKASLWLSFVACLFFTTMTFIDDHNITTDLYACAAFPGQK